MTMLGGLLAATLVLTQPAAFAASKPDSLRFYAGSAGGAWYPWVVGIADIFTKAGVKTSAELGGGASNIVNISNKRGHLGVTFTVTAVDAAQGEDPFKSKITNIRGLFTLADNLVEMVATRESGIKTIPELKGRKVALQQQSAGVTGLFRMILKSYGMSENDLNIVTRGGTSQCSAALQDRRAEFYVSSGGIPAGTTSEIAVAMPIRLLPVDDAHFAKLLKINPGFLRSFFPAGTYRGQDEVVPGVGAPLFVVGHETMPEDHAYWIVRTLVEHIKDFRAIHESLKAMTPEFMASFSGIPMHPGAAKYYKEIGVLK
jgi:TRAP transporter TAXI family solute receptor